MCPGGSGTQTFTEANPCEFTRKLCVTCEESGGDTYIRVQSNMMPNHCVNAKNENAQASNVDFSVIFNRDVSGTSNYSESDLNTAAKTEELLCDL